MTSITTSRPPAKGTTRAQGTRQDPLTGPFRQPDPQNSRSTRQSETSQATTTATRKIRANYLVVSAPSYELQLIPYINNQFVMYRFTSTGQALNWGWPVTLLISMGGDTVSLPAVGTCGNQCLVVIPESLANTMCYGGSYCYITTISPVQDPTTYTTDIVTPAIPTTNVVAA